MNFEILFAKTDDFLQPCLVATNIGRVRCRLEVRLERGPQAAKSTVEQGRRQTVKRKAAAAFLDNKTRFLEELEMARYARLSEPQYGRELRDVQTAMELR